MTDPCAQCPWRLSNQGKRHPDGWYTVANLRRLWGGLKRGEAMSCHPTDPDNPVSEKARAAGVVPAKDDAQARECRGALILQQREVMRYQGAPDSYLRTRRGLTRRGLLVLVNRHFFGSMEKPNLNEADVGAPFLDPWEPRT